MREALDDLFHVLHLSAIVVNLTFWVWRRTLRIAQVTLGLTLASWFGFGLVYGFGYCFLTDWHWRLKHLMGERDLPASYVKYVLDGVTLAALLVSVLGCGVMTIYRRRSRSLP